MNKTFKFNMTKMKKMKTNPTLASGTPDEE